jgi:hypothetical protein
MAEKGGGGLILHWVRCDASCPDVYLQKWRWWALMRSAACAFLLMFINQTRRAAQTGQIFTRSYKAARAYEQRQKREVRT